MHILIQLFLPFRNGGEKDEEINKINTSQTVHWISDNIIKMKHD